MFLGTELFPTSSRLGFLVVSGRMLSLTRRRALVTDTRRTSPYHREHPVDRNLRRLKFWPQRGNGPNPLPRFGRFLERMDGKTGHQRGRPDISAPIRRFFLYLIGKGFLN